MIAVRKTHREKERELGVEGDRPVHNLLKCERKNSEALVNSTGGNPQKRCRNTSIKIKGHETES